MGVSSHPTRRSRNPALGAVLALAAAGALWLALREPAEAPVLARSAAPETHAAELPIDDPPVDLREPVPVQEAAPPAEEAPAAEDLVPEELEELVIDFSESKPLPPDPVQPGPALLDLQLVDADSEEGVASHVELWRIDAPENEHWTEGDQLQDQAWVPVEGWAFRNLPEGRYRVVCHAQVWGEEAAEVEVRAPRTRLSLDLELPRAFRVRLDVRDRFGVQVASLALVSRGDELVDPQESWRNERMVKNWSGESWGYAVGRGWVDPFSHDGPQPPEGFDLGSFYEVDRGGHRRTVLELEVPGGGRVRVTLPTRRDSDLDLIAVVVAPSEVEPLVRVPPGFAATIELRVVGQAIERDTSLPGGGWERAPVSIRAWAEGLNAVEHAWRAADGELPPVVLEAAP